MKQERRPPGLPAGAADVVFAVDAARGMYSWWMSATNCRSTNCRHTWQLACECLRGKGREEDMYEKEKKKFVQKKEKNPQKECREVKVGEEAQTTEEKREKKVKRSLNRWVFIFVFQQKKLALEIFFNFLCRCGYAKETRQMKTEWGLSSRDTSSCEW